MKALHGHNWAMTGQTETDRFTWLDHNTIRCQKMKIVNLEANGTVNENCLVKTAMTLYTHHPSFHWSTL